MAVSVIIPFQSEDPLRIKAYSHVAKWWLDNFSEYVIFTNGCEGEFSKGEAAHNAAQLVKADVLIIADADSFILNVESFRSAIDRIGKDYDWYVPHNKVHRLSAEATEAVYAGNPLDITAVHYPPYFGCIGGGIVGLTRDAWDASGGIDPRFIGWGGEDRCWGYALKLLGGRFFHGQEKLIHLWHGNQGPRGKISPESYKLIKYYEDARHDRARMKALVTRR